MNPNDHRVREYAYQIWESEGRPFGHADRHWQMACDLVATHTHADFGQSALNNGDTDTPASEPINPISPGHPLQPGSDPIQPTDPIHPTDPIQPSEPTQPPAQPIAVAPPRKTRAKVVAAAPKSLIDNNPVSLGRPGDSEPELKQNSPLKAPATPEPLAHHQKAASKKTAQPRKPKATEQAPENA